MKRLLILSLLLTPILGHAETYKEIGPLDTLGDIKSKFPKAVFAALNPAWAQDSDALHEITGKGLSGKIIVKFSDSRPAFKKMLEQNPEAENADLLKNLINQENETALTVDWVRWIPDNPIPLPRFISKYGKPDVSGFTDEDLTPYRSWAEKGLSVSLTDDEKLVYKVDFEFTKAEYKKAYREKRGFVPDWLKDNPTAKKDNPSKK